MPHIAMAMRRSLGRSVRDIISDSLLGKRSSITDDVSSVKTTFSSWDGCMAKNYCKYPVIAAIIVAGLIIFSVLWCIIRCACCGMSCCCTCFSFLKCCSCCCGDACAGKKNKSSKYRDDPDNAKNVFSPQQGYQAQAPMMGGGGYAPAAPQFATFDVGRNGLAVDKPTPIHEDALPPMPSWETATKKHVLTEDEKNAVELGELDPTTGQHVPLMGGGISSPPSPNPASEIGHSQYGGRPVQGSTNGYMGAGVNQYSQADPYSQSQRTQTPNSGGYRGAPRGGPGMSGRGPISPGGSARSFGPPVQTNYGQEYGTDRGYPISPAVSARGYAPSTINSNHGYGSPAPQELYGSRSDLAADGYDRQGGNNGQPQGYSSQPTRQFSGNSEYSGSSMNQRQHTDQSYRSGDYQQPPPPRGPSRGPTQMPMNNSTVFELDSGGQDPYSRPAPQQQQSYNSNLTYQTGRTAPPSYATRSPPPQDQSYIPYGQQSRGSPTRMMSDGGRSREPEHWDPVQR